MYSAHRGQAPKFIKELVQPVSESSRRPGLRSASTAHYNKPRVRTVFTERAFSLAGPAAWNSLPSYLHEQSDLVLFKKKLKTYLFSLAFN